MTKQKQKEERERLELLRLLINLKFPDQKINSVKALKAIIKREEKKRL